MSVLDANSVVITDTSILINLIHTGHLAFLGQLPALRFVVPDEVIGEILEPDQSAVVEQALASSYLHKESITGTDELTLYLLTCARPSAPAKLLASPSPRSGAGLWPATRSVSF